jgi:hypothetical protein
VHVHVRARHAKVGKGICKLPSSPVDIRKGSMGYNYAQIADLIKTKNSARQWH